MSILITGAAGFVGSHLADHFLARGETVIGLDSFDDFYARPVKESNLEHALGHERFHLIEGDVRDPAVLGSLPDGIEGVIHMAARAGVRPSIRDPALYADVNVGGTAALLELVRLRGIPSFILGSSSSVYGSAAAPPFSERDAAVAPISPYAATKRGAELLCHAHTRLHGTACVCLRLFTVYGPRQRPDLAIRKFSGLLLSGEPLPRYGDGSTSRDYTYHSDVTRGVVAALDHARRHPGAFEIVNLGGARAIRLSRLIALLGKVFQVEPRIEARPPQAGDLETTRADISRARELLGYDPSVSFEDGLRRFAEWYLRTGAAQDGAPTRSTGRGT